MTPDNIGAWIPFGLGGYGGVLVVVHKNPRGLRHPTCRRHFRQLLGATVRGIHWNGVVEAGKVDLVLAVLLLEGDQALEAVPPQHFTGQVGAPRLRSHARALHDPLQYHDQLELLPVKVLGRQLPEGAVLVDLVHDDDGPDQEQAVPPFIEAQVHVELVEGQHVALLGNLLLDEHGADVGLHDLRLAHVAHAEEQAQVSVLLADAGALAEHEGLGPLLGPRQFGEHDARHQGLADDPEARLEHHQRDSFGARLCRVPRPVADGVLGLYRKQQGGGEGVNFNDARFPIGHTDVVQVAVRETHEPPDEREDEPADDESHGEEHEVVAPLDVYQRGEDVG